MPQGRVLDARLAEAAGRQRDAARLRGPDPVARARDPGDRLERALGGLVRSGRLS
jgi:hypothetical protein